MLSQNVGNDIYLSGDILDNLRQSIMEVLEHERPSLVEEDQGPKPSSVVGADGIILESIDLHNMDLSDMLINEQVEWPPGRNTFFIPCDRLGDNKFTHVMVRDELRKVFPAKEEEERVLEDATYICANAKKIFSILLCGFGESKKRVRDIRKFVDERISDSDLPFIQVPRKEQEPGNYKKINYWLCTNDHGKKCVGKHNENCSVQAMASWSTRELENFFTTQWTVLAPVFRKIDGDIPHQDFDINVIMPYIEDFEREAIIGRFSRVWKVKIHPAH
jgi:hypothetical protein